MDFVGEKAKAEMSKASAFPAALKQTNEALQDYFKSLFNLRTTIFSIVDNSKTAAKTVKINLNKRSGVNTKDQFIVKEVVYEDGEAVDENEIGLLKLGSQDRTRYLGDEDTTFIQYIRDVLEVKLIT